MAQPSLTHVKVAVQFNAQSVGLGPTISFKQRSYLLPTVSSLKRPVSIFVLPLSSSVQLESGCHNARVWLS
jgi:hypothetical protein